MSIADAVAQAIKVTLLPELTELRQMTAKIGMVLDGTIARLDRMQQEMDRRFEQIDKRFEQIDRRLDETRAEHSKRMDLLEARILEVRADVARLSERQEHVAETVGRLTVLGDYVRRIDEFTLELREQRRRLEDVERRLGPRPGRRLPRAASG